MEHNLINLRDRILYAIKDKPDNWSNYSNYYQLCEQLQGDIPNTEIIGYTIPLKQAISEHIKSGNFATADLQSKYIQLIDDVLLLEARSLRFDSYMSYLERDRQPEKRFWLPRREQLLPIVNDFQDLVDDNLDVLFVSVPPGSGKSTIIKFLLSMIIGAYVDSCNLTTGHSQILTKTHYEGVMQIISDPYTYRWNKVFPKIKKVLTDAKDMTINLNKKHPFANMTSRSIDGSLTGATRADKFLIMDDMVQGLEEALSAIRMQKLSNKIESDVLSRMMENCKLGIIGTRWSVSDPLGHFAMKFTDDKNKRTRIRVIPLMNEKNISNFDYKYSLGYSTERAISIKENTDDATYRALYDGEPIEREGLLYPADELRYFFDLPDGEPDAIISVVDSKDKGKDYYCAPIAYKYGEDYYIEDVICDNSLPDVVEPKLINAYLKHNVKMSRFESNSAGGRAAADVQERLKEKGGNTKITTKFTSANKETKIIIESSYAKEHFLFRDKSTYAKTSDYATFMKLLTGYMISARNAHDDAPDTMAMLSQFAQETFSGYSTAVVMPRFF